MGLGYFGHFSSFGSILVILVISMGFGNLVDLGYFGHFSNFGSILIILVVLEVFLVILKVFMGILVILIVLGFLVILKVSKGICIWPFWMFWDIFIILFFFFFYIMNKQSSLRQKEYTKKVHTHKTSSIKAANPSNSLYHFNGFLGIFWSSFGHLDVVEILWLSWFIRYFILFSSFGNILIILYTIDGLTSENISSSYCWLKLRL